MRLVGIDGSHLLGFMAALGVLRLMDEVACDGDLPRPTLSFDAQFIGQLDRVEIGRPQLVSALAQRLSVRACFYGGDLSQVDKPADFTPETFEQHARTATARWQQDALSGLACATGSDEVAESTLCAANGAGHQELIQSVRDVLSLVEPEHLEMALLRPWSKSYSVPPHKRKALDLGTRKPTLRLDPADERLYALRATNPTPASSEYKTELGAQALAIPAFELLPVCPSRRPTCIASRRGQGRVFFEWMLWSEPATLATVRSILAMGPHEAGAAPVRGAFAAFRVARVTGDKGKLSVSPTVGIWHEPLAARPTRAGAEAFGSELPSPSS
jgi:hypothetical protein